MIKLIIFDLDGTLLKTIDDITDAVNYALIENSIPTLSEEQIQYMVGSGVDHLIMKASKEEVGTTLFNKVKEAYLEKYHNICHNKTMPYPGIKELIKQLKQKHLKIAILSNKPQNDTDEVVNYYFGRGIFDIVLGQTTTSNRKPAPDGVFTILEQLKIEKEEILYVGDTEIDLETARRAGVVAVGVTWGYRKLIEIKTANHIINRPQELLRLISGTSGIIVLNKEAGLTSQAVVNKVKKIIGANKIGHAGTLDPMATGVLIVLINEATKISDYLMANEKKYSCTIALGKSTTTEDSQGEVISEVKVNTILESDIDLVLKKQLGKQMQTPPMYSSIKVNGQKLYELARKGIDVLREARSIEIKEIKRTSDINYFSDMAVFSFEAIVTKGTYMRSLCVKIGDDLGIPAHMYNLVRLSSGQFDINDAVTMKDLECGNYHIISMINALSCYKIIEVDDNMKKDILNGKVITLDSLLTNNEAIVVLKNNNQLLGIYEKDHDNEYKAKRIWN